MDHDDDMPSLVPLSAAVPTIQPPTITPPAIASVSSSSAAAPKTSSTSSSRGIDEVAVPMTILTGWLGSGKTTLLTHIVQLLGAAGKKMAIIQNEASSLGVEDALQLTDDSGAFGEMLELGNGCVCCSVKSDFLTAVEALLKKRKFDYILLECSGLADPGALARMLWADDELECKVYLDGIIALVDCRHLDDHLKEGQPESNQVLNQLAFADRILLNKTDLVSESEVATLTARVAKLNSVATLIPTLKSKVELNQILDIKAFEGDDVARAMSAAVRKPGVATSTIEEHKTVVASVSSDDHIHDSSIRTLILTIDDGRVIDLDRLKRWLGVTLWAEDGIAAAANGDATISMEQKVAANRAAAAAARVAAASATMAAKLAAVNAAAADSKQQRLFRIKAIMSVQHEPRQMFLQGVQELFDIEGGANWPRDTQRYTRMVIIGRYLDEPALRRGLESCCIPST